MVPQPSTPPESPTLPPKPWPAFLPCPGSGERLFCQRHSRGKAQADAANVFAVMIRRPECLEPQPPGTGGAMPST